MKQIITIITALIELLDKLAFLPMLGLRLWVANIFWKSGLLKIGSWDTTISLFADEYKVPFLPPEIAAYMGTATELTAPVLLALGLGSRAAAAALLFMTGVIEFTYMMNDEHIVWALALLLILCCGPGKLSIDHFIRKRFMR